MKVQELSREQKIELKQTLLVEVLGCEPSWEELADADSIVSDRIMEKDFARTDFTDDDFFCSC